MMKNLNDINLSDVLKYVKQGLDDLQKTPSIVTKPKVKILADSYNQETDKRLTTFECTFWRAILPEITRHRVFSFSVRSSRAVPISTLIEEVRYLPWGPEEYGTNQKGMQAGESLKDMSLHLAELQWSTAAKVAARSAEVMEKMGVHKQIVNRLLEPYVCVHAVISGTEWDNFFKLRISPLAQPEMQTLAKDMKKLLDTNVPANMNENSWHLPYVSAEEEKELGIDKAKMVSAARCARVSYKPFNETTADSDKDFILANKLIENGHWSPFEHVACPALSEYRESNFKGWNQYRKYLEN